MSPRQRPLSEPRRCKVCRCTDARACLLGCSWVGPELCSTPRCVELAPYVDRALALIADLEAQGARSLLDVQPALRQITVTVRWPAVAAPVSIGEPDGSGPIVPVDGLELMCCGCAWTAVAGSYAQLAELSGTHDDAPSQCHIVRLAAGGRFPDDQESFAAELERVRAL